MKESQTVALKTESGTFLVTGANGSIGDALMRRSEGRFESVVGFDRHAPEPPPPGCTYMPVEITSDESVREGLRMLREHHGGHIASLIHLAAYYDFLGEPSEKYEEITVRGTGRLLRGLRDADFQVDQFVFSSTMLVHRPAEPGQFINEDWPIEATWAYPESKVRTEKLIHDERGTIPAGLGAAAYTIEMLMGWMGGKERWRSMPWMVFLFFILVVPLGIVSITLVILQPVMVGSWCSVCLFTALIMLLMIPFAVDEVVATGQFLKRSVREGKSLWRTFWIGGTLAEVNDDQRTPKYGAPVSKLAGPMAWGVTAPWNLVASAALGIWLMFSPAVFGTQAGAANSDHLVGALIAAVAVIAMAEVVRAGRFLNVLLGVWIIAAPWLLSGAGTTARWNDVLAGAVVILLSLPRGPVRERYAGWDRFIV